MKHKFFTLQFLYIIVFILVQTAYSETINNPKEGFSINLPQDWIQLNPDSVNKMYPKVHEVIDKFDYLYKIENKSSELQYPFILIQHVKSDYANKEALFRSATIKIDSMTNKSFLALDTGIILTKNVKQIWLRGTLTREDNKKISLTTVIIPCYKGTYNLKVYFDPAKDSVFVPDILKIISSLIIEDKNPISSLDKNKNLFILVLLFIFLIIPILLIILSLIKLKQKHLISRIIGVFCILISFQTLLILYSKLLKYLSVSFSIITLTSIIFGLILCIVLAYYFSGHDLSSYGFNLCPVKEIIKATLIFLVIVFPMQYYLPALFQAFGIEYFGLINSIRGNFSYIIALIAAVQEEVLFRGVIQSRLSSLKSFSIKVFGFNISYPVIISSTLFGSAHLTHAYAGANLAGGFLSIIFATLVGFLAGYYREKTDSILPSMAFHLLQNSGLLPITLFWILKMFR